MSIRRLLYYDLQAESSEWLFKSPLAGGGGLLCQFWFHTVCAHIASSKKNWGGGRWDPVPYDEERG